jgi:mitochondrial import inner membrane translocase subunit TIM21
MIRHGGKGDFEYKYLFVDIKGMERIYLENADTASTTGGKKKLSLFGVKWG